MGLLFNIVDVFAEKKDQGNQLAVVHVNGRLSDNSMLEIAKEMNARAVYLFFILDFSTLRRG